MSKLSDWLLDHPGTVVAVVFGAVAAWLVYMWPSQAEWRERDRNDWVRNCAQHRPVMECRAEVDAFFPRKAE